MAIVNDQAFVFPKKSCIKQKALLQTGLFWAGKTAWHQCQELQEPENRTWTYNPFYNLWHQEYGQGWLTSGQRQQLPQTTVGYKSPTITVNCLLENTSNKIATWRYKSTKNLTKINFGNVLGFFWISYNFNAKLFCQTCSESSVISGK